MTDHPTASQLRLRGTSQRTRRSLPARNTNSHGPDTASAADPAVTAQRTACDRDAPLVSSSTAHTTAAPGTTVGLNRIATPATRPQRSGASQRAAHAAQNSPRTVAIIAGHDP